MLVSEYSRNVNEAWGSISPMSMPLPQEIIEMIIDEVDLPSAYECALSASCFVRSARRRMFRTIRLTECECRHVVSGGISGCLADFLGIPRRRDVRAVPSRSVQLVEILDSAPDIGLFVKELIIEGNPSADALCPISSWYCHRQAPLPAILSRLPNLEKLSLLFPPTRPLFFRCLPVDSARAIIRAAQSPNLRIVILQNVLFDNTTAQIGDLFDFIRLCASGGQLSELTISEHFTTGNARNLTRSILGAPFAREGDPIWDLKGLIDTTDVKKSVPEISLSSLSIHGNDFLTRSFLNWARETDSPVSLTSLKSLTLGGMNRNSVQFASQVIQFCSKTLERLSFAQEASHSTPCPSISYYFTSDILHVKDLRFVDHHWDELRSSPTLNQWCAILESSACPHLTTFTLDIHWHLDSIDRVDRFRSVSWYRLDSALFKVSPGAKLCVNVAITVPHPCGQSMSRWKEVLGPASGTALAECFPMAHRKGSDGFRFSVTVGMPRPSKLQRPVLGYEYAPVKGWTRIC